MKLLFFAATIAWAGSVLAAGGVEGGIGVLSTNASGASTVARVVAGIFDEWGVENEDLVFRPELLYQASQPDYIDIPLMLSYKLNPAVEGFKPYLFAGPELDFRISGGGQPDGTFKPVNFAFAFGLGADYWVTKEISVGLNWRYSLGLANQNATGIAALDFKTRAMYLLGAVGYQF